MEIKRGGEGGDDGPTTLCKRASKKPKWTTNREPSSSSSSEKDDDGGGDDDRHGNSGGRDFPEWLLLETLTRLPIKTIFTFRCVSKRWNSVIISDDSSFARFYISRRSRIFNLSFTSLPWTLLHHRTVGLSDLPPFPLPHYVRLHDCVDSLYVKFPRFSMVNLPLSVRQKHYKYPRYKILASSNGLLLCTVTYPTIYYVCNPLTRQWVALPRFSKVYKSAVIEGLVTRVEGGIVNSYKVVRLLQCSDCSVSTLNMEIFASETRQWSTLVVSCPQSIKVLDDKKRPISLNGILHWFTLSNEIVAYDPYNCIDQCRLIKLPGIGGCIDLCGVCLGRLQYFEMKLEAVNLWVLEDYDTGNWLLEHNFVGRIQIEDHGYARALAFDPFDSSNIYMCNETRVFCYNTQTKRVEHLYNFVCKRIVFAVDMVVPIVLPLWPPQVPRSS